MIWIGKRRKNYEYGEPLKRRVFLVGRPKWKSLLYLVFNILIPKINKENFTNLDSDNSATEYFKYSQSDLESRFATFPCFDYFLQFFSEKLSLVVVFSSRCSFSTLTSFNFWNLHFSKHFSVVISDTDFQESFAKSTKFVKFNSFTNTFCYFSHRIVRDSSVII